MRYIIIAIAFSIMSAFVGCLLPFVSLGSHTTEPINIIFGFLYGLGWYAAGLLSDPRNPWAQLIGGKIWPLFIMGSIVFAAGFLRKAQNPARAVIMAVLFMSLFTAAAPPHHRSPFDNIPTYFKILSAVY
jgi:hypothetical protein